MRALLVILIVACARATAPAPQPLPASATPVEFPGTDAVMLHGFLYLPKGDGPFPAVLWNHGSERLPGWQPELAAFYTEHGYAFFIPHRRGQGRSSGAGPYIVDRQPAAARFAFDRDNAGREFVALQEEAAKDVDAAVAWLKVQPGIDPGRIVMSGCSFGGIQTVLAAERGLGVKAFVAFAPGAMSWSQVDALADRLKQAAEHAPGPLYVVQAKNDFSVAPSEVLGPILEKRGIGRALLFPEFGKTNQEGHGAFASKREGAEVWGPDVLALFQKALSQER